MKKLINKYIGGIQRFQLHLETLTPVAIRNGEVLSPLTDYHIEGNKLYMLDADKLMNDIVQNNWLDDFENKVLEYSGNHSGGTETNAKKKNRFLADFLKEKGVSIKSYLQEENARACQLKTEGEWVQLHSTIKTANQAYIPGSSIKGAIRTAIMYQWLTETEEGKEFLKSFIELCRLEIPKITKEKDEVNNKRRIAKEAKKEIEEQEFKKRLKEKEIESASFFKSILEGKEQEISNRLFGNEEGEYKSTSFFKVSDAQSIKSNDLIISSLQKKYREDEETGKKRNKEFTTSLQEFIDVDKDSLIEVNVSNLNLDWKNKRDHSYFSGFIKDSNSLSKVFKAINKLSQDFVEFEIGRLNTFKTGEKTKELYTIGKLTNFHNSLIELRKKIVDHMHNQAITCIGFGKSTFTNTILLAIKSMDKKAYKNYIKVLHPSHPDHYNFPISYYTTTINSKDYPLGWVRITDVNKDAYQVAYDLPNFELVNLKQGDTIQGALIERSSPSKVEISIDGVKQIFNANGLSKFEKHNNVTLQIGTIHSFQIVAIKENIIKDLKFI